MIVFKAPPLSLVVDTIETLTYTDARALLDKGFIGRGGYIDRVTPAEIGEQLSAGLPFFPICFAKQFDGAHVVARLQALNLPPSTRVSFDDEGETLPAPDLIAKLDTNTKIILDAGFRVAGYFGAQEELTSSELTRLLLDRYWKGCSRVLDRMGGVVEPVRGWCAIQGRPPNVTIAGKVYDVSFTTRDYLDDSFELVSA